MENDFVRKTVVRKFLSPLGPLGPIFWAPVESFRVDGNISFRDLLHVLVDQLLVQGQDVLTLVVIDQVEILEGRDDVVLLDRGCLAQLVDGDLRLGHRHVVLFRVGLSVQKNLRRKRTTLKRTIFCTMNTKI